MTTEQTDLIDTLVKSIKLISNDRVVEMNNNLSRVVNNLKEVGDPEKVNIYIELMKNVFSRISNLNEEINDISDALREENAIDELVDRNETDKKFMETIMPYVILYSSLNGE